MFSCFTASHPPQFLFIYFFFKVGEGREEKHQSQEQVILIHLYAPHGSPYEARKDLQYLSPITAYLKSL